ncbi:MAG TPA: hypothetical protein H9874_01705, partial [Candidatus Bilophila faecipullorum]|nr:hypothetical protein [Candidatus Bilophila faecipullorum]
LYWVCPCPFFPKAGYVPRNRRIPAHSFDFLEIGPFFLLSSKEIAARTAGDDGLSAKRVGLFFRIIITHPQKYSVVFSHQKCSFYSKTAPDRCFCASSTDYGEKAAPCALKNKCANTKKSRPQAPAGPP